MGWLVAGEVGSNPIRPLTEVVKMFYNSKTKEMKMKSVDIQILDGNLTNEMDPTTEQLDDYVDMLRAAVSAEIIDAEINIDLQRDTSGCSQPATVCDESGMDYSDDEYTVNELKNQVWVEWMEKHELA